MNLHKQQTFYRRIKQQSLMRIQYTVVKCTLNQRNLSWTDAFCLMPKKKITTKNTRLLQNELNVLDYSTVCVDLSHVNKLMVRRDIGGKTIQKMT